MIKTKPVSDSRKRVLQCAILLLHESGSKDCTIMTLDMDEWYLLFQPLFENYFESIKSDQRDDSLFSCACGARSSCISKKNVFFQSVDIPRPARESSGG
jgi:hypothetical protein